MIFPTAREVAVAIATAARLHDEDPVLTVEGAMGVRGRWLAIAALQEAFPGMWHGRIATICGLPSGYRSEQAHAEIKQKRSAGRYGARWWLEADLETVKAALAAEIARTDGRPVAEVEEQPRPQSEPECQRDAPVSSGIGPKFQPEASECNPDPAEEIDDEPPPEAIIGTRDFLPEFTQDPRAFEKSIAEYEASEAKAARNPTPESPKSAPSAAALAIADFHRRRPAIIKTERGHVVDHRLEGVIDLGDPEPSRSALNQRGSP